MQISLESIKKLYMVEEPQTEVAVFKSFHILHSSFVLVTLTAGLLTHKSSNIICD